MNQDFIIKTVAFVMFSAILAAVSCVMQDYVLVFNTISFLIWIVYSVLLFKHARGFSFIMLSLIISCYGVFIPNLIFEQFPLFIVELNEMTYATGALTRLIFFQMLFFLIASLTFYAIGRPVSYVRPNVAERGFAIGLALAVVLISLYGFSVYGSPLFQEMLRFEYWGEIVTNPVVKIAHYLLSTCFALLLYTYMTDRRISLLLLVAIILVTVLGGDKFTPFLFYAEMGVMIYFLQNDVRLSKRICMKMVSYFMVFLFFTIALMYYHYTDLINNVSVPVEDMFLGRIAQQGQTWWAVDKAIEPEGISSHIAEFSNEIDTWFQLNLTKSEMDGVGLYKIMNIISTPDRVERYLFSGIRFTEGYPAIGLYYFGFVGLFFLQILVGMVYGIWARTMYYAIMKSDVIMTVCLMKIGIFLGEAFGMGNMYGFFNFSTLAYLAVMVFYLLVRYLLQRPISNSYK